MDAMSDQLCRAYDAAECCRNVHSDPAWRTAAGQVCMQLGDYISQINHHEGMYRRLSEALEAFERSVAALARREAPQLSPAQLSGWCEETVLVARKLKQDMEQAGIHLPPLQRARVAELMAANGHFAAAFNSALTDPRKVGRSTAGLGRSVPLDPASVAAVMAGEPHESVRKEVYMAAGSSPSCNRELLDRMVGVRRDIARLQGFPSYAALRTSGSSLAAAPAAVVAFLERLAADVRPLAGQELGVLAGLKASDLRGSTAGGPTAVHAWDVEYYAARARRQLATSPASAVLRFTALPSVLAGVRLLLRRLFRIDLAVEAAAPGEAWAPGVLRCTASHPDLGPLGAVYLDLGDRPGKYPSAVTFPITCGRQLPAPHGGRQLPVMALLASASGTCPSSGQPAMTWRELRVLLHELGHCVHNLLSLTKYQHLWGTRCAQDLVEVPSHLFEYFVADPRVMALLARDRSACGAGADSGPRDGEPMPEGLLRELVEGRSATAALELQQQLVLSLADQWLFGEHPPGPAGAESGGLPTSDVWQKAVGLASSVAFVPGTSPELRVGHLTIYGGAYYGYVYARCLAAQLWRSTGLADDPLDPAAGEGVRAVGWFLTTGAGRRRDVAGQGRAACEILRAQLLAPGGSVEPLQLLAGLAEAADTPSELEERQRQRRRTLNPPQRTRHDPDAAVKAGLLQALAGGYAPRPERYLETLKAGL
ncbi:Mitochondrial intermediate peptidase [Tetrabaena socialis]|uniref:Mitochondrial intermediate peptidase n=1 Tax=Tetrabaena socialis TaxID=47790 RepID=A0A2J8A498_9CHLO|nr:Mitochondrial intermediate peptidase [Tetrabaena socialis]|eukprot:PNH07339.1 Mitochondrial intermediate peptidase [Tetrabaena socialis]